MELYVVKDGVGGPEHLTVMKIYEKYFIKELGIWCPYEAKNLHQSLYVL